MRHLRFLASISCALALAGCSTFLSSSGPRSRDVVEGPSEALGQNIRVVDISEPVIRRIVAAQRHASLAESFGQGTVHPPYAIEPGDSLEISVWEAPPAALFGNGSLDSRGLNTASLRVPVLPEQTVNSAGDINMPFAGVIRVAGLMPEQVEKEITNRLKKKANEPQVVVRVLRSAAMVTVMGEVNSTSRFPLSARGERLLDALASSGGMRQPTNKITIQVTRNAVQDGQRSTQVVSQPLDSIIADPSQNIPLQPGDIITVLSQPNSFTVFGATARNDEVSFEAPGITLAQALARVGGLQDQRANPTGVFLFRFEDSNVATGTVPASVTGPGGKVPVIYRADLRDPATFFLAQNFPIRNRDMLYVANAQAAELQKFINLLTGVVVPILTIQNLAN